MFRILDQAIIFLLIVGTYTPFALAFLRTGWWLGLLIAMWAVALIGFVSKVLYAHRVDSVSVAIYLALGWTPIIAGWPLTGLVPARALWWMLIGGLCYTLGAVFLLLDRRVEHFHAVWHLLVIAGSGWHFLAIYQYVAAA
jgi:hemolysin III